VNLYSAYHFLKKTSNALEVLPDSSHFIRMTILVVNRLFFYKGTRIASDKSAFLYGQWRRQWFPIGLFLEIAIFVGYKQQEIPDDFRGIFLCFPPEFFVHLQRCLHENLFAKNSLDKFARWQHRSICCLYSFLDKFLCVFIGF